MSHQAASATLNNGHDQRRTLATTKCSSHNVEKRTRGSSTTCQVNRTLIREDSIAFISSLLHLAGTYQCTKANYEIILCPSGGSATNPPNPTTSQPSQGNVCNGQGFDSNAYWCDGGRLCSKGERACGSNPHSCYKESMYNCVNGQLAPK